MAEEEIVLSFKLRLGARVCAPLRTGRVAGWGGAGEEEGDPWKEVGGRRLEGVALEGHHRGACEGEEQVEEEVRRGGNEEGTSSLDEEDEEDPTL